MATLRTNQIQIILVFLLFFTASARAESMNVGNRRHCEKVFDSSQAIEPIRVERSAVEPHKDVRFFFKVLQEHFFRVIENEEQIFEISNKVVYSIEGGEGGEQIMDELGRHVFLVRVVWGFSEEEAPIIFTSLPKEHFSNQSVVERINRWQKKGINIKEISNQVLLRYSKIARALLSLTDLKVSSIASGVLTKVDGRRQSHYVESVLDIPKSDARFDDPIQLLIREVFNSRPVMERRLLYGHFVMRLMPNSLARIFFDGDNDFVFTQMNDAIRALNDVAQNANTKGVAKNPSIQDYQTNDNDSVAADVSRLPRVLITAVKAQRPFDHFQRTIPNIEFRLPVPDEQTPWGYRKFQEGDELSPLVDKSRTLVNLFRILSEQFYQMETPFVTNNFKIRRGLSLIPKSEWYWTEVSEDAYSLCRKEIEAINELDPELRMLLVLKYVAQYSNADIGNIVGLSPKIVQDKTKIEYLFP